MTISAAGILFVTKEGKALFLKRGPGGDYPGLWCFPGGKQEDGESIEDCAKRECVEEIGSLPEGAELQYWTRSQSVKGTEALGQGAPLLPGEATPGETVDFTTYLVKVENEFPVVIDGEHVGYAWSPIGQPPEPLHPGCQVALDRFNMDELGIAEAIRDGRLTSPQVYANITLFDIRITGTGAAFRQALNEFVIRDPALYLNERFLTRCQGLPVIVEHPPTNTLTSSEFAKRVVGTVLLPYIKGDEVWGIAKIYDQPAAEMLAKEQFSTSPAVAFHDPAVNEKLTLEDGADLLIEGKPSLLDHIALCEVGVWDKGGDPAGVISAEIRGDSNMAESAQREDSAAEEDRARMDAENGEKLDKLLSHLDSLSKRLDSMESEEGEKADASEEEDEKKSDADEAEEEAEEGEGKGGRQKGEPVPVAADKARTKKDADEEMMADKARKDSAAVQERIARIERMLPKQLSDADYAAMAGAQASADKVYAAFGDSAPRPLQGEDLLSYRKRLATGLKAHSTAWSGVDLGLLPSTALDIAEAQIYNDSMKAARNPAGVPEGQLREVPSIDATGRRSITFVGRPSSWMNDFSSSRRYLTGINTNLRSA